MGRTGGGAVASPAVRLRGAAPFLAIGLAVLFLLMAFGGAQAQATQIFLSDSDNVGRISVPLNKSETIRLDTSFAEVLVGSSDIADVLPLTDRSIYVLGKQPGTTNISIVDSQRRLLGVIDLEVTLDTGVVQSRIRESTGNPNIIVSDSGGQLVISGTVNDAPSVDRAIQIASQFAPGNVINAMNVTGTQQVMLKVRFVEASRSAGRELGLRFDAQGNRGGFRTGAEPIPTINPIGPDGEPLGEREAIPGDFIQNAVMLLSGNNPMGVVLANLVNNGFNIDVLVKALEGKGLARSLAEPNLVTLSGDTADFLAGGEFPVPLRGSDGEVTIEYKQFGVQLAFTPTVLRNGHINLKLEPSVSQLDFSNAVQSGGVLVPALTTRRANTTIEMRDGQSFAIAGLLQTESRRNISQLPWIGSIPVIGALFRSANFQKNETDLVIIVTPYLVQPGAPGQHIATPLDKTLPTNDVDFFMMGKMEVTKDYRAFIEHGTGIVGPYGHMIGLNYGHQGVVAKQ